MTTKPPLGIMPHEIWKEQRALELSSAITRQREHYDREDITYDSRRHCLLAIISYAKEIVQLEMTP